MPPNYHYAHQNSCDNKAITISRAQLAYSATLCDVIIATFTRAHVPRLVPSAGEDGRRNGCRRAAIYAKNESAELPGRLVA